MKKTIVIVILSLVAGFAVGAWSMSNPGSADPDSNRGAATDALGSGTTAEDRLAALERIISEEREARLVLEDQLQKLFAELERIDSPQLRMLLQQSAVAGQAITEGTTGPRRRSDRSGRDRDLAAMRTQRLVNGGFSEARASEIRRLEDEARMDVLRSEYEAQRDGDSLSPWDQAFGYQSKLREKLGDAEFERYLQAQGSVTAITVRDVIDSSPANRAGLRPGDEIVEYDGNRVFGMYELRSMSFSGNPGEDVVVEVVRDGQRMQLVLPRGPLGITGSGANMAFRGSFGG
jgi:TolA-binding protein